MKRIPSVICHIRNERGACIFCRQPDARSDEMCPLLERRVGERDRRSSAVLMEPCQECHELIRAGTKCPYCQVRYV